MTRGPGGRDFDSVAGGGRGGRVTDGGSMGASKFHCLVNDGYYRVNDGYNMVNIWLIYGK